MITNLKTTIWALALLFSVAGVLVLSSCGSDDEPDPVPPIEIVPPSDFTYAASTVAVGSEGSVDPSTVDGTDPAFAITATTDGEDVAVTVDFFTVDAATGKISVAAESTTGLYKVTVTATNTEGTGSGTAEITIGVNDDFNPTGKSFEWQIFMNRSADVTLIGLDGVPGLPISDPITLPTEWPTANTPENELFQYSLMTGVQELLMQVPGDEACGALDPSEGGDTLLIIVNQDLTISVPCNVDGAAGSIVQIGTAEIKFEDDKFVFSMLLEFLPGLALPYVMDGAKIEEFTDVYTDPTNPTVYQALQGTVIGMTTPTDLSTEESIQDFTKWATPNVDVVLKLIE